MHNKTIIVWVLLGLNPIIGMAVDLIAPALPAITKDLNISENLAQNIISAYIFGYAVGAFSNGLLADAWGRRLLLRINLISFVIVSIIPIFIPHISILLVSRLLQGITLGASSVLARTIITDILTPNELVKIGATLGIMWGIGPVVGPVIGSYLATYWGWKSCFSFFAIAILIELILVILIVPETQIHKHALKLDTIQKNLKQIVSHKLFMGLVILMGLAYSLAATFHTMAPFLIQNILHHSTIFFGHIALLLGIVFLISSMVGRYLIQNFAIEKLFSVIISTSFIIITVGLGLSFIYPLNLNLIIVISAIMFSIFAVIYPLAMGQGMSLFKEIAGTASAVMFINVLISSFISFSISFIRFNSIVRIVSVFFILILFSVLIYWAFIKRNIYSPN